MSYTKEFVSLDKTIHDRESFDCGEPELNSFIRSQASRLMDAGISKTMVLPASLSLPNGKVPICAFYSIAPSLIKREDLPEGIAKKLPRYPIPVFLLAQLAVHQEFKGLGLGKVALVNALEYFHNISAHMPAYAVVVDCLNKSAESFYLKYGFQELCKYNERSRLFIPMKQMSELFG
ncbi:GNAT family N-acetyltransferase [Cellvibrio mixtus]|uniref:GNAT family N-acetyltransferase n=1 Tax=Cellvibrio mixtus TaxID=39650 RepID=UPI0005867313|nr:GNAT family N-acetyltransferase [Cellvibrio mixtus]